MFSRRRSAGCRGFRPIDSEPLDDGFGEAAAAHGINLGLHQSGQVIGDLLVGDGSTIADGSLHRRRPPADLVSTLACLLV